MHTFHKSKYDLHKNKIHDSNNMNKLKNILLFLFLRKKKNSARSYIVGLSTFSLALNYCI